MRLKITHRTEYSYDRPDTYALQRLRLVPSSVDTQTVHDWGLEIAGATEEVGYTDGLGNQVRLASLIPGHVSVVISASGTVETYDKAGIVGPHRGYCPLWLFKQETDLTRSGERIEDLVTAVEGASMLDRMHSLLGTIVERVEYKTGVTGVQTSAEEAAAAGAGVCQDQAHIFISAARKLGVPARYVSGYLMSDAIAASHAWAEVYLEGLGWVAFDPANGISPDDRYVRLAVGRDYRDAAPISGYRLGESLERLEVHVTVEQ